MQIERTMVAMNGLACASTALAVKHTLTRLPGIVQVHVNPLTEMAYVRYDAAQVTVKELVAVLERAGFRPDAPIAR